MSVGLMLMTVAAVKAQFAYSRQFDEASAPYQLARSAILYALAGSACFIAAKVMR
ncbi:hypothetical protein MKK70_24840 [Methylobacterium sp. E-041]|uniref:hypothetical protein n=1 Tax=Methylobacterium sp. E-041 TaxID=2836573 RepID=UPI001FBB4FEB|nr:hypothetical protein [Methylobacterium sp. E-041]MCJ2108537.1 hypothetical protein [Methylobacterium sp. E-041]